VASAESEIDDLEEARAGFELSLRERKGDLATSTQERYSKFKILIDQHFKHRSPRMKLVLISR